MPTPTQPYFRYDQLQDPDNEIRLMSLQREKSGDLLQFTLFTVPFPSVPRYRNEQGRLPLPVLTITPYKALSYEWGRLNGCKVILVNGVQFLVQQNLHSFLQAIHSHYKDQLPLDIWVDAVCINQDTTDVQNMEKNHQVRMMGRIYSTAEMVLVWLGEDYDMSAVHTLLGGLTTALRNEIKGVLKVRAEDREIQMIGTSPEGVEGLRLLDFHMAENYFNNRPDLCQSGFDPVLYAKDHIKGILEILALLWKQSYWSRLWIVQELVLARNITVLSEPKYCGTDTRSVFLTQAELHMAYILFRGFEHCHWASLFLSHEERNWRSLKDGWVATFVALDQHRFIASVDEVCQADTSILRSGERYVELVTTIWARAKSHSLEDLIQGFVRYSCSDPRDFVYGLLGIADNMTRDTMFEVDYESDYLDLLAYTMAWCEPWYRWRVAQKLVPVLTAGPESSTLREDGVLASRWLTALGSDIERKGSKYLSTVIVFYCDEEADEKNKKTVLRFDAFQGRNIVVLCKAGQREGDHLVLADHPAPKYPYSIGRNSRLIRDHGFLRHASLLTEEEYTSMTGKEVVKGSRVKPIALELCDALYMLALGIYGHQYRDQWSGEAPSPALLERFQRCVFGHRRGTESALYKEKELLRP